MPTNLFLRTMLVLALACAAGGCADDDDDDVPPPPPAPPPFSAARLVAVAGEDRELARLGTNQSVSLDGSKSVVRADDGKLTPVGSLAWALVSAPAGGAPTGVPLATTVTSVTFPASSPAGTYTFELTATGSTGTDKDRVDIIVKPFIITEIPDKIQVGFTLPGGTTLTTSITAATSGTVSGTATFAWTGVPAFARNVTGATAATLTFGAPELAQAQGIDDRATVLGLWAHSGGYNRLTVTATDAVGNTDSEDVIVSFGLPTNGLENVPINTPVYLNGGLNPAGGTWTWTIASQPAGSTITLYRENNVALSPLVLSPARVVWFTPKAFGFYTIIVQRDAPGVASQSAVFTINAAGYVSDGLVGTIAPNPDLGHCAGCHGGSVSFIPDKVTAWSQTDHASRAAALFDPANASAQARIKLTDLAPELSSATTGYYVPRTTGSPSSTTFTASNNGFDDIAAARGFSHRGITYNDMEARYPETASLTQIQCEACHGPGNMHVGDTETIDVSIRVDVCARCHDHEPAQWNKSTHKAAVASPSTRDTCVRCHTAGAALDARHTEFRYPDPSPAIPVPNEDGRAYTATCASCHSPHDATNNFQLRVHGQTTLPGGVPVEAGDAATCFQCHNARNAFSTPSVVANRSEPHYGLQGDSLVGVNGGEFAGYTYYKSPHADPARFVDRTGKPGRWCVTCHMASTPTPGQPGHDEMGGHTFRMRSSDGSLANDTCTQCHGAAIADLGRVPGEVFQEFGFTARDDWDGDGAKELVQDEVAGLMQQLGGSEPISLEDPFGVAHLPVTQTAALLVRMAQKVATQAQVVGVIGVGTSSGAIYMCKGVPISSSNRVSIPKTADGDLLHKAVYNYIFGLDDGSLGIHNTGYTVGLLQSTIIELRRNLGDTPFTGTPYRP